MSETPTNITTDDLDKQARRLLLKQHAVTLAGELAAHGARVELGKITHLKAVIEVRQTSRERQDVIVTSDDGIIGYQITTGRTTHEFFTTAEVCNYLIARPSRWRLWWQLGVILVSWGLLAIGWRLWAGPTSKYILMAIVLSGAVATVGVMYLVRGFRKAGRRRRALEQLSARRKG